MKTSFYTIFLILLLITPLRAQNTDQASAPTTEQEPQIVWSKISDVNNSAAGQYFYMEGKIKSIDQPDIATKQPWKIYLEDPTGFVQMVIFQDAMNGYLSITKEQNIINEQNGTEKIPNLAPGLIIQVYGKTQDYKGSRQFVVENPNWLRIAPGKVQKPEPVHTENGEVTVPLGNVSFKHIGSKIVVMGKVESYTPHSPDKASIPGYIKLNDGTGSLQIVYWGSVHNEMQQQGINLVPGTPLGLKGEIGEFRGNLQMKITTVTDMKIPEG